MIRHLDLFSGIGGASLAIDTVYGRENVEHIFVEIDTYCQKVLNKHWPQSKIYGDIRKFGIDTYAESNGTQGRIYKQDEPDGSLVKMLAVSLLGAKAWYSDKCVLTWKLRATKSKHLLYQLSPSMRRTEEIGYGLLHILKTPTSSEAEGGAKIQDKYWNAKAPKLKLRDQIGRAGMLGTPKAQDSRAHNIDRGKMNMGEQVQDALNGKETGLKLQPNFVEWMMGYPLNWTDLNSPSQGTELKD